MTDFRPEERDVVYIGEGASLSGAIRAQDTVIVDGAVEGEITCAQLIVGPTGVVNGTINVTEADVHGKIGADVTVKQLLMVRASGRVEGKWTYGEIEVEKGAALSGTAEPTEYRAAERKAVREERTVASGFKKPELIVNEPTHEEPRVASLASRALRDRRRI
jgi:cytoskeletal protein CcmA (bactofilin family)